MFTYLYVWTSWLLQHSAFTLTHEDPALSRFSRPGFTPLPSLPPCLGKKQLPVTFDLCQFCEPRYNYSEFESRWRWCNVHLSPGYTAIVVFCKITTLIRHCMIVLYGRSYLFCYVWVQKRYMLYTWRGGVYCAVSQLTAFENKAEKSVTIMNKGHWWRVDGECPSLIE